MSKKTEQAKITNMHGTTMMSVDKMSVKDDAIVMTGNIMGSMPGSFYVKPEEMWKMMKMVNWRIICAIPGLLLTGRREYRGRLKNAQ